MNDEQVELVVKELFRIDFFADYEIYNSLISRKLGVLNNDKLVSDDFQKILDRIVKYMEEGYLEPEREFATGDWFPKLRLTYKGQSYRIKLN